MRVAEGTQMVLLRAVLYLQHALMTHRARRLQRRQRPLRRQRERERTGAALEEACQQ